MSRSNDHPRRRALGDPHAAGTQSSSLSRALGSWNILHKQDHKVRQERLAHGLDTQDRDDPADLGNIETYPAFLTAIADTLALTRACLVDGGHLCMVLGDFRHKSRYYMLHADIAHEMEVRGFTLKGIKVLYQRHKRVFPYGFPYAYVPNLHRQYLVILANDPPENAIHHSDATAFLRGLPDSCADLIIADPPYRIAVTANLREIPVQLEVAKECRRLEAAACNAPGQARSEDVDEFREMPFIHWGCAERSLGEFDLDNRSNSIRRANQRVDVGPLGRVQNSFESRRHVTSSGKPKIRRVATIRDGTSV